MLPPTRPLLEHSCTFLSWLLYLIIEWKFPFPNQLLKQQHCLTDFPLLWDLVLFSGFFLLTTISPHPVVLIGYYLILIAGKAHPVLEKSLR